MTMIINTSIKYVDKKVRGDETKTQAFETKTLEELTCSNKSHPNNKWTNIPLVKVSKRKFIRSDLIDTVNLFYNNNF